MPEGTDAGRVGRLASAGSRRGPCVRNQRFLPSLCTVRACVCVFVLVFLPVEWFLRWRARVCLRLCVRACAVFGGRQEEEEAKKVARSRAQAKPLAAEIKGSEEEKRVWKIK